MIGSENEILSDNSTYWKAEEHYLIPRNYSQNKIMKVLHL